MLTAPTRCAGGASPRCLILRSASRLTPQTRVMSVALNSLSVVIKPALQKRNRPTRTPRGAYVGRFFRPMDIGLLQHHSRFTD
jgi:hypothetical protein